MESEKPEGKRLGMKGQGHRDTESDPSDDLHFKVNETPPPLLCLLLALQQVIMTIPGSLSIPMLLAELLCADDKALVRAHLMGITFFMCGLATLMQTVLGIRLPIIQGGSHTFIPPVIAMMALERWQCPTDPAEYSEHLWKTRMREIQGNLMLASLVQVLLGCTGLMGLLLRFIGPLTIAPTIALIGLSLTNVFVFFAKVQWGIASLTVVLVLVFSLLLGRYHQPCLSWSRDRGFHVGRFPVVQLLSPLLAMVVSWLTSHILTVTEVFPNNVNSSYYMARTDVRLHVLREAPWISFPYPFQFGLPTVSAAGFWGMLVATMSSVVESIGDYYASARICRVPFPPPSAMNRAVAMEGLASVFSGMLGAGHATTSYSNNTGAVGITKVASLRVFQLAGVLLIVCGMSGKVGAVLTLVPDPVVGGVLGVILGLVASVGLSIAFYADMKSLRNMTVLGVSLFFGLALPQWVSDYPDAIETGSSDLNQILKVVLGTPMSIGGIIGCILDNILPGTLEERGLVKWLQMQSGPKDSCSTRIYDIPYITGFLRKIKVCSYLPVSPTYSGFGCTRSRLRSRDENGADSNAVIKNGNAASATKTFDNHDV
ncbi:solute carrier family 23 member 2-like [Pomacea canaliculata]|uniref:solute carrier family 23 member 2-like n=1 Tax=Pomacea canaliculata TaxID=400727 RepID=UPI000D73E942|nr:solute carrier family 23 member 2-like [Pomacea canaliculata]XP_025096396.1 solute carrier family 23 member 2-like [Pomacea canaliculata]XP_025096397.1 solute carrier family 23 member 2-like [Pomacea canaliculata]